MRVETLYEMNKFYTKAYMISEKIFDIYIKVHGISMANYDFECAKVSALMIDTFHKARKTEKRKYRSFAFCDDINNSGRIEVLANLVYLCESVEDYKTELKYLKRILLLQKKATELSKKDIEHTIHDIIMICNKLGLTKEVKKYENCLVERQNE